ncbi:MAG: hypothetical protein GXY03_14115 [Solirubrobacterales bacterium]|nr:hypothetical protein [Solirubrobacterales bacterium]
MSKSIDSLDRRIRARPGAAKRIDARTDAMRSVLRLAELMQHRDEAPTPASPSPPVGC